MYVSDAPRITLSFGASIDDSNIEEGNDVYFECHIEANPSVYKVEWRRNVSTVLKNWAALQTIFAGPPLIYLTFTIFVLWYF